MYSKKFNSTIKNSWVIKNSLTIKNSCIMKKSEPKEKNRHIKGDPFYIRKTEPF